jgi:hypothetical protein
LGKGSGVQQFANLKPAKVIVITDVTSGTERRLPLEL